MDTAPLALDLPRHRDFLLRLARGLDEAEDLVCPPERAGGSQVRSIGPAAD
jgi:hypothetical protein